MTTVARLLPRHWDGRRLLQFLAGLALVALAFALPALLGPAAPPAEDQVTIVTTVDTPLPPGLPVTNLPNLTTNAPTGPATDAPAGLAADADAGAAPVGVRSAGVDRVLVPAGTGLPVLSGPHGRLVCDEARAAAGATQRTHSERGPPQA